VRHVPLVPPVFGIPAVRPSIAKPGFSFLFRRVIRSSFAACKFVVPRRTPRTGESLPQIPLTIERRRPRKHLRITRSFTGPCTIPVDSVGSPGALDNSTRDRRFTRLASASVSQVHSSAGKSDCPD